MSASVSTMPIDHASRSAPRYDAVVGLLVGAIGGGVQCLVLGGSWASAVIVGALFGSCFGFFFSERTTSPGAGLIWASRLRCSSG